MYTQEYEATKSTPQEWEPKLGVLVTQNVRLLLEVKNLYADTVVVGNDFPGRSADPTFKLKLLIKEVYALMPALRKVLCDKLFIGTDFPMFAKENSFYLHQLKCMRKIFNEDFDQDRTASNFLTLLPKKFAGDPHGGRCSAPAT